jgi:hypothetical protein
MPIVAILRLRPFSAIFILSRAGVSSAGLGSLSDARSKAAKRAPSASLAKARVQGDRKAATEFRRRGLGDMLPFRAIIGRRPWTLAFASDAGVGASPRLIQI